MRALVLSLAITVAKHLTIALSLGSVLALVRIPGISLPIIVATSVLRLGVVAGVVLLLASAALAHLVARAIDGVSAFEHTLTAISYSAVSYIPLVLSVGLSDPRVATLIALPFIGFLGWLWSLAIAAMGAEGADSSRALG